MKKLYGVIGDPIGHSMSPDMHNDAFQSLSMDAHYHAFQIEKKDLEAAVLGMKAIGISGFNVTVPHKTAIMPLLDEVDPLAQAIGAVNTVVLDNGRFIGYNTDGEGFLAGLEVEYDGNVIDKRILLLGAGGSARAIYYTLSQKGAMHIDIGNRTLEKAEELKKRCPYPVKTSLLTLDEAAEKLADYDIIIQTTSIGMSPNVEAMPISLDNLHPDAFVADIIYNPIETAFMKEAKVRGAKSQNGAKMLSFQGALAFEKWTGILPEPSRMETIIYNKLGGIKC